MDKTETPNTLRPDIPRRPSFVTPEMIEKNPILGVAGIFAGDPAWQEILEEIKRNRERDQLNEDCTYADAV